MKEAYLVLCFIIALIVPHVSAESVGTTYEILLQIGFVLTGLYGFKVFSEG